MIFIQASNIHTGGGAVLLNGLLTAIQEKNEKAVLYADQRFRPPGGAGLEVRPVQPTVFSRFFAERRLARDAAKNPAALFLFFGNLPPLFKTGARSFLFFQNVILLEKKCFYFPLKTRLKHAVERLWLRWGVGHISTVCVQSESVRQMFLARFPSADVKVLPFSEAEFSGVAAKSSGEDFIYVSSGDPHKNHLNLLRAWKRLAANGIRNRLLLVGARFPAAEMRALDEAVGAGARVELKPELSHDEVLKLYRGCQALIFPSLSESFGLPLLEAKAAGLPVIAAEKDYVRDLLDPAETFDPDSDLSIARAVQRFLAPGKEPILRSRVLKAADFLKAIGG